jgi:hypothetical protein
MKVIKIVAAPLTAPKHQILWAIPFENTWKIEKNEFSWKPSPDHKMPRNTNFRGVYPLKTREKSQKWILV